MGKINVSGTGVIKSPPDVADITFEVRKTGKRCGEAINAVNDVMKKLHEVVLTDFSIEKKLVKTTNVGSEAVWSPAVATDTKKKIKGKPATITGYEAWNGVTLRIHDIARIGELLSALTGNGASSLDQSWDIDKKEELEDQARKLAFADAKRKAQLYAQEAGIELGKVEDLTESQRWSGFGASAGGARMAKAMVTESAVMDAVPMESGEQVITINVSIAFAIA